MRILVNCSGANDTLVEVTIETKGKQPLVKQAPISEAVRNLVNACGDAKEGMLMRGLVLQGRHYSLTFFSERFKATVKFSVGPIKVSKSAKIVTLSDLITQQVDLSDVQKANLFKLVCSGTRLNTRLDLIKAIDVPLSLWGSHSRFNRVQVQGEDFDYAAGQSYPDEIRELRKLILKNGNK